LQQTCKCTAAPAQDRVVAQAGASAGCLHAPLLCVPAWLRHTDGQQCHDHLVAPVYKDPTRSI